MQLNVATVVNTIGLHLIAMNTLLVAVESRTTIETIVFILFVHQLLVDTVKKDKI